VRRSDTRRASVCGQATDNSQRNHGRRTVVVAEVLDALEVGQAADAAGDKLAHGEDAVAVRVEAVEDLVDDLDGLLRVHLEVLGALAALLVVHAVNRLELVAVEDAVAAGVGDER